MHDEWRQEDSRHDIDSQGEPTRTDVLYDLTFFEFTHNWIVWVGHSCPTTDSIRNRDGTFTSHSCRTRVSDPHSVGWLSVHIPIPASDFPRPTRSPPPS